MQKQISKIFILLLFFLVFPSISFAAPIPVLNFSDIDSGPKTGNSDGIGSGAIVTIWGNYLGSTQGSSKVYVGGVEATAIYYWKNADGQLPGGPSDLYTYHKMQEIAFAIPADAPDGATTIKVKVNGIDSTTLPFTVRSGNIYFVKSSGNNAANGSWNNPWLTLGNVFDGGNAKLIAGDIVYSHGVGSTSGIIVGNSGPIKGTSGSPVSLIMYPNTSATISGKAYTGYVVINFWGSTSDKSSEYINFSKLKVLAEGDGTDSSAGFGTFRGNRIVGAEITGPTVYGGYSGAIGGGCSGVATCNSTEGGKYLGLYIHNYGTDNGVPTFGNVGTDPSNAACLYSNPACKNSWDKFQHLFYISNRSGSKLAAYEIAWGNFINNPIYQGIHIYDQTPCGDWSGTMEIHNNVVKNQRGAAINVDLGNCSAPRLQVPFRIYDNIIINDATVAFGGMGMRINVPHDVGVNPADQVQVYNNTVYGQIAPSNFVTYAQNQIFRNNIFVDTQNVDFFEQYSGNPTASSNNLFYSLFAKVKPTWAGAGTVSTNPFFVDGSAENFNLQATSSAIAAGSDASLPIAPTDFFGQPRSAGSVSIGAIQYFAPQTDFTAPAAPSSLTVF
jgi:hypothetical protein